MPLEVLSFETLSSPPALLGLAIALIFMGILVPRRFYKEVCDERDRWREAYEVQRERADASDAQTAELLEVTKTTHAFIVAVFNNSSTVAQQTGRQNVVP